MHEDDCAGSLLAQQAPVATAGKWSSCRLLMMTGWLFGLMLIRSRRSSGSGETVKPASGPRFIMQRPSPDEGDYFKTDWLSPYDMAPAPKTIDGLWRLRLCRDR